MSSLRLFGFGTLIVSLSVSACSSDVAAPNGNGNAKAFATSVDVGSNFTCVITGAGPTDCWGRNDLGQLGRGTTFDSTSVPTAVSGGVLFTQISVGPDHACGLDRNGAPYCWGQGVLVPTRVVTTVTFASVSAGSRHTCGLDTGGFAWCWGENTQGELGSTGGSACGPTIICSAVPLPVSSQIRYLSISAGRFHTCAVSETRDGYCWGYGGAGAIGAGTFLAKNSAPVAVTGGLKFASIAAASDGDTSCGLTADGTAWCWGIPINSSSLKEASAVPVAVAGGVKFKDLSVSGPAACGIALAGGAYCWGDNFQSRIGSASRDQPTLVANGLNLTSIMTALSHTCGVDPAGEVYCFGDARWGELGSGAKQETGTPVKVIHS